MKKSSATTTPRSTKGTNGTTTKQQAILPSTQEILRDFRIAVESRQASLLGRREVLTGKAKFGIFGDGKEVAQLAMARAFRHGDWRSGYYRDQTFMFAIGESDVQKFFAQLYAHTDVVAEPASAGRSMNGHFATRFLADDGSFLSQTDRYNVSADVSPTGSQMPRLVGLAYASVLYRQVEELRRFSEFSRDGNEVAFGTIGNASCAEGMFWEAVNAIGVLRAPAIISVWDDGYGISVPNHMQVTKSNVGELLGGFQRKPGTTDGYDVHVVRAWDYPALLETYARAAETARTEHVPQIVHVIDVTQPQGHSTSGSHERYKSPERLQWEKEFDGITRMRTWMIEHGVATEDELDAVERDATANVQAWKAAAWDAYMGPIRAEIAEVCEIFDDMARAVPAIVEIHAELAGIREPFRKDIMWAVHRALLAAKDASPTVREPLLTWSRAYQARIEPLYASHLHSESSWNALQIQSVPAVYADDAPMVNGSEVMNACFDAALTRDPRIVAFGEDVGHLGDVNQGFSGLQAKHGMLRVSDTGIREVTILGQAIGMAMRGLRPIAEIQYLDYVLYALQLMSDDLATVQWRTRGGQKAPVIVRTRGHRLEGIWHSGSPMAGIINLVQ
jgi:TPP-dependent pyruvate/acetoin dehydrogenase alpha subunit